MEIREADIQRMQNRREGHNLVFGLGFRQGKVVTPDLVEGLGNDHHRLVQALVQNQGRIWGRGIFGHKQFVRFDAQGRNKLDHGLRGDPAIAVLDIAQKIDRNIQFFRQICLGEILALAISLDVLA